MKVLNANWNDNLAAVVLAAGDGSRFGFRPKGLLERDGQPLVARQIGLLARAGLRRIVVVLGRHAAAFEPALRRARAGLPAQVQLDWVRNPAPELGTGASLRCALARLADETERLPSEERAIAFKSPTPSPLGGRQGWGPAASPPDTPQAPTPTLPQRGREQALSPTPLPPGEIGFTLPSPLVGEGLEERGCVQANEREFLTATPDETSAVLVLLADQPLLQREDIDAVLRAWQARAPGIELVVPTHQGRPGHPLVFGAALRRWLALQPASEGVRDWRRAHPAQVRALPLAHPRCTLDIDTEADLAALAAAHGIHLRWPDPIRPAL